MGSKNRHAREILPIILKDRKPDQWYVEPFVGGCNVIDKVTGNRMGNDVHPELIAMWIALQNGWIPDKSYTLEDYNNAKTSKDQALKGYIGFNSYGAKWFGGYRRDKNGKRDYWEEHYNNIMKQICNIRDVRFSCMDYTELVIPDDSIIYCDPPYLSTTEYKNKFDHEKFWSWARQQASNGHNVFVSEYQAPDDFVEVWSKEVFNTLVKDTGSSKGIEKLFIPKKNLVKFEFV